MTPRAKKGQPLSTTSEWSFELIRTYEQRQGLRIGCLEEIAFDNGWIDREELTKQADIQAKSEYGRYLRELASRR